MKPRIGLITIGQSPRPDIVNEMRTLLGNGTEILEAGALDGLSKEEVLDFIASAGTAKQGYLVTRLQDGTSITIPKEYVADRIGFALQKLENQHVGFAAILCVGDFPEYTFGGILLRPGKLLIQLVMSIQRGGKGVIVIPLEEERHEAKQRWNLPNVDSIIKVIPTGADSDTVDRLLEEIKGEAPTFVVLECMGWGENLKNLLKEKVNCPVILPKTLLACTLKEIM